MSVIRSSFAVIKMHHFIASLLLLTSLAISYGEFNIIIILSALCSIDR